MLKTYDQVHAGLFWMFGKASEHTCLCGARAQAWAYQHSAGEAELVDPRGRRYSESFEDYRAMCVRCHRKLDWPHRGVSGIGTPESRSARGVARAASMTTEERSAAGRAANRIRRRCLKCLLVTSPGGLGTHQSVSGHTGWETVERTGTV